MMKKQQKWTALLVILTFVWLLQVSSMPVTAANSAERIGSASPEQEPSFVEKNSPAASQVKKKSILPMVLIGAGVVAVAAVLFLVVLKTDYDIVGEWRYSWKGIAAADWAETNQLLVFNGDKKSGKLSIWGYPGSYTVDGKTVSFMISYMEKGPNDFTTHTGAFDGKNKISGTWKNGMNSLTGYFEAVRGQ